MISEGPLTWVEAKGLEPSTPCLQTVVIDEDMAGELRFGRPSVA